MAFRENKCSSDEGVRRDRACLYVTAGTFLVTMDGADTVPHTSEGVCVCDREGDRERERERERAREREGVCVRERARLRERGRYRNPPCFTSCFT